ncbi:hypothetical protein REPUB_Repub11eG0062200 [Reevesia pubescens]
MLEGLAIISRLARSRLHQSDYGFEDRSIDWDQIEMYSLLLWVFGKRKGERRMKSVCGCIVSQDLSVRNLVIVKKGENDIPGHIIKVKIGSICPTELRAICEQGLLLLTLTIPEMEHILWPFLLKMIIPQALYLP